MSKIDFVIMWVDDSDKAWSDKKKMWQQKYGLKENNNERFRDWDTLKYLFRGIDKFAGWVNTVYLVTDNQVPEWLNLDYSKVKVVDHQEFIPEEFLPTFNSHSIELNLHRIPGLSENFVLFNDDMFLTKKVSPSDFFVNNQPKDNAAISTIVPFLPNKISRYIYNNIELINEEFSKKTVLKKGFTKWFSPLNGFQLTRTILLSPWTKFTGFHEPHLCVSYNKCTFNSVWDKYEEMLYSTSLSKFRENHNLNQWVMRYWQLASNNFSVRLPNFGNVINITDNNSVLKTCKLIKNQKYKVLCVNDTENVEDFEKSKKQITSAFEHILSEISQFERHNNV